MIRCSVTVVIVIVSTTTQEAWFSGFKFSFVLFASSAAQSRAPTGEEVRGIRREARQKHYSDEVKKQTATRNNNKQHYGKRHKPTERHTSECFHPWGGMEREGRKGKKRKSFSISVNSNDGREERRAETNMQINYRSLESRLDDGKISFLRKWGKWKVLANPARWKIALHTHTTGQQMVEERKKLCW
jgi:hypothetical protein